MKQNIWQSLSDEFTTSLPRLTAIVVKEDDYDLGFYHPADGERLGYCYDYHVT